MEWEMWLLLVLALPFVLYAWAKSGLGRIIKSKTTRNESVA